MNTMYATGSKSILWHLVNAVILTAFLYFVGIYPIDLLALQISGPHNTIRGIFCGPNGRNDCSVQHCNCSVPLGRLYCG